MRAIRFGIYVLIAFAVLSFGGLQPWGQAIVEIGAASLLVLWGVLSIRRGQTETYWNWLYLPLVSLGAMAILQYGLGLSVYPYLTKMELLRWGAYALLFFLAVGSFHKEGHAKQLVWFLTSLGFVVSLFGIIQHFAFNGKLYWLVPLSSGAAPFGPFVNADHFAGFVELTAPLGLALLFLRSRSREQFSLLLLFTIVPVGAMILCASRAGIVVLVLEFAIVAFLSSAHQIARKRLLGAAAVALLAGIFIFWLGPNRAIWRFEQFAHEGVAGELRISIYKDTSRIFLDHPWTGTGLGTLVAVYPAYASFYNGRTVDHAHNDFLELLADTGVIGGLCGLSFVGFLVWQGLVNLRLAVGIPRWALVAGPLVGCAGLLLHSLVDFNLHVPSNVMVFLMLAFLATAKSSPRLSM